MGLDMYLNRERYVKNWDHMADSVCEVSLKINGKDVPLADVSTITERVGYWRKANAIHRWFCSLDEGRDECQKIGVTVEQLRELSGLCQQVMADHSKAEELLPTTSGFFFGGTEYDQYYLDDLRNTIEILAPLIVEITDDYGCPTRLPAYYYEASW